MRLVSFIYIYLPFSEYLIQLSTKPIAEFVYSQQIGMTNTSYSSRIIDIALRI